MDWTFLPAALSVVFVIALALRAPRPQPVRVVARRRRPF